MDSVAKVVIASRSREALHEVAKETGALPVVADVARWDDVHVFDNATSIASSPWISSVVANAIVRFSSAADVH